MDRSTHSETVNGHSKQSTQNGVSLLSPQEVADRYDVTRRTVYKWIDQGKPKFSGFKKVGGRWKIREEDLPI